MSHAPSNPVSGIRYTKPRATVNSRNYQKRIQSKCSKKLPRQTPRCSPLLAPRSRSDLARNSSALPMHNFSFPNRHRNSSRKALSVATGPGSTMPCPSTGSFSPHWFKSMQRMRRGRGTDHTWLRRGSWGESALQHGPLRTSSPRFSSPATGDRRPETGPFGHP